MTSPCPICRNGISIGPQGTKPCTLCSGTGSVDPEVICICGKPATLQVEGLDKLHCGNNHCADKIKTPPKVEHQYKEDYREESHWWQWNHWRGGGE